MGTFLEIWNMPIVHASVMALASHVLVWLGKKATPALGSGPSLKDKILGGIVGFLQKGISSQSAAPEPATTEPVSTSDVLSAQEKALFAPAAEHGPVQNATK